VTDEPQYISYPDLERVSRMVYDAAIAIGNAPTRPKLDAPKQTDPNAPCLREAGGGRRKEEGLQLSFLLPLPSFLLPPSRLLHG